MTLFRSRISIYSLIGVFSFNVFYTELLFSRLMLPYLNSTSVGWSYLVFWYIFASSVGSIVGYISQKKYGIRKPLNIVHVLMILISVFMCYLFSGHLGLQSFFYNLSSRLEFLVFSLLVFPLPLLAGMGSTLCMKRLEDMQISLKQLVQSSVSSGIGALVGLLTYCMHILIVERVSFEKGFLLLSVLHFCVAIYWMRRQSLWVTKGIFVISFILGIWGIYSISQNKRFKVLNSEFGRHVLIREESQASHLNQTILRQFLLTLEQPLVTAESKLPENLPHGYWHEIGRFCSVKAKPQRVLVLGGGVGLIDRDLKNTFSDVDVLNVEIDHGVYEIGKRDFDTKDAKFLISDARNYINRSQERYDCIVFDVYNSFSIPPHLMSVEFFTAVKRVLSPGGVAVFNLLGTEFNHPAKGRRRFMRKFLATVTAVWPVARLFSISNSHFVPSKIYEDDRYKGSLVVMTSGGESLPSRLIDAREAYGINLSNYLSKFVELPRVSDTIFTDNNNNSDFLLSDRVTL